MQLQFEKQGISCLQTLKHEIQNQEQTQELRISDGMPDIGRIIGTWGQVILRGKEWQDDGMSVNGGTMVWVQYMPEDGGTPQCVESWLPFQMRWTFPQTQHDGTIMTQCLLRSVDARSLSARKLMLRSNISVLAVAMEKQEKEIFVPSEIPEDVYLRMAQYPMLLPVEAGEKAFHIEETLSLPTSAPRMEKLILYTMQPEITEQRLMGDKLVFRGNGNLHILYSSADGTQYGWDFDIPFTQYSELDADYTDTSEMMIWPGVTALELDSDGENLHFKAGLVCQYRISHRPMIQVAEDAYSVARTVAPVLQELDLPGILESKTQTIHVQQNSTVDGVNLTDVRFFRYPVQVQQTGENSELSMSGQFQLLYYDMDGQLRTTLQKWEEKMEFPAGADTSITAELWPVHKTQGTIMSGNAQLSSELKLTVETCGAEGISMITALELGEAQQPDPHRPSLILRRADGKTLWELAKQSGSTVTAIRQANGLQTEPEDGQMLLIPVI